MQRADHVLIGDHRGRRGHGTAGGESSGNERVTVGALRPETPLGPVRRLAALSPQERSAVVCTWLDSLRSAGALLAAHRKERRWSSCCPGILSIFHELYDI